MGVWDSHRPKVMACCCCTFGLVLLIISSVVFANRLGEEVKLWYNVPLCETTMTNVFVSYDTAGTVTKQCPTGADAPPADFDHAATISFNVPLKFFNGESAYNTFLYRTEGSDLFPDSLPAAALVKPRFDITATGAFGSVSNKNDATTARRRRATSLPTTDTTTDTDTNTDTNTDGTSGTAATTGGKAGGAGEAAGNGGRTTGRRLLKGSSGSSGRSGSSGSSGFSSGPSYRSRNGNYGYYGAAGLTTRRYSRSSKGPVVETLTVVSVYSAAPIILTRGSTSAADTAQSAGCTNVDEGCELVITKALAKDELTQAAWTTPAGTEDSAGSLPVTARALMTYPMNRCNNTATTKPLTVVPTVAANCLPQPYPHLFVVFATDDTNGDSIQGYVLIPIACFILCCGTMCALSYSWPDCPSCSRPRGVTKMGGHRSSITGSISSEPAGGLSMRQSVVDSLSPFPHPSGPSYIDLNGDHTSTSISHPNLSSLAGVDLTNNDVTHLAGLDRCTQLECLTLSNNDLRTLQGLHRCPSLIAVNADSNQLHSMNGLVNMRNLRWFSAADNDINSLAGAVALPSLAYLGLASNDLSTLAGIENFPGLTHLNLSNNDIRTLSSLDVCQMLIGVDLSQNSLTNPDEVIRLARMPNLILLDVRGNDFSAVNRQRIRDAFRSKPHCKLFA